MDPFARTMWRFGLGFGGGVLVAVVALSAVYFHARPRCSDRVVSSSVSPDQQWTATVLERRCGEEAAFFTHVNVRPAAQPEHYGFFSGRATDDEVFEVEEDALSAGVVLAWTAPNQLTIRCPQCSASLLRHHAERSGPVAVTYAMPDR
jgi:hypothetical protein